MKALAFIVTFAIFFTLGGLETDMLTCKQGLIRLVVLCIVLHGLLNKLDVWDKGEQE